jgi:hypothetical protein
MSSYGHEDLPFCGAPLRARDVFDVNDVRSGGCSWAGSQPPVSDGPNYAVAVGKTTHASPATELGVSGSTVTGSRWLQRSAFGQLRAELALDLVERLTLGLRYALDEVDQGHERQESEQEENALG